MKINICVMCFGLLLSTSCQNEDNSKQATKALDTVPVQNKEVMQPDNKNENVSEKKGTATAGILSIENKMRDKKKLGEADYIGIDNFLKNNADESSSEEFGYTLFEYLKKNKSNNISFLNFIIRKKREDQNIFLHKLIKVMCIDIGEENYSYENFIKDFELFNNNESAKKSLKDCTGNDIQ